VKRLALSVLPVLPLAVLLTGCGGSSDASNASATPAPAGASASASGTASGAATGAGSPSPSAAAFNPCHSLSAAKVSKALGTKVKINTGTADTPRCALLPVKKNGPTFELSYLWFDGGLDAAWKTMDVPAGTVTTPTVVGADDTRQVVQQTDAAYAVSAFLQNGKLIQSLNGLALAPYDAKRMERATAEILAELSAHAPQR
jgi:hypothetical protein